MSSPSFTAPETTARRLRQIERRYGLVTFLNWFAAILPSAVIVLYAQSRGLSLAEIGLYGAVYSGTVALLELPTGNLADSVGRKRVALLGYALAALAKVALLLAFSLPTFLVYAVIWGMARALGSGALEAWFVGRLRELDSQVDLQPPLARVNSLELLALGAGSLIGAAIPNLAAWAAPHGWAGFSPLSAAVAASLLMHLLTLIVAWRSIDEPPRSSLPLLGAVRCGLSGLPAALRDVGRRLRQQALLPRLLFLELLTGLMLAASETYWQPFFDQKFHLSGGTVIFGVLLAGCFLAGMLGNLCAGPLLGRLGGRTDHLGGLSQLGQALALLALAWQPSIWLAATLFWFSYFARTAFSSSFLALYNGQIQDPQRSLMLSVLSVSMFVGVSLGSAVLGAVSNHFSIAWAWTLVAGVLVLSVPLFSKLVTSPQRGAV